MINYRKFHVFSGRFRPFHFTGVIIKQGKDDSVQE